MPKWGWALYWAVYGPFLGWLMTVVTLSALSTFGVVDL